jgi:hypothetical protein
MSVDQAWANDNAVMDCDSFGNFNGIFQLERSGNAWDCTRQDGTRRRYELQEPNAVVVITDYAPNGQATMAGQWSRYYDSQMASYASSTTLSPSHTVKDLPSDLGVAHVTNMDQAVDIEFQFLHTYWADMDSRPGAKPATYSWINEQGGTATGCGIKQKEDALGEAAFYCFNDHVLYLDASFLWMTDATYGAQGVAAVIAHEYGHHIEDDFGVKPGYYNSRNIELYADFAAGAFMVWYPSANVPLLEMQFLSYGDAYGSDPNALDAHGLGTERGQAFDNGYYGRPMAQGLTGITISSTAGQIRNLEDDAARADAPTWTVSASTSSATLGTCSKTPGSCC